MRGSLAGIVAAVSLLIIAAVALAAPAEQSTPLRAPVPDCGVALCVVPKHILMEVDQGITDLQAEVVRLTKELADAKRAKKCAKLEVTS